MRIDKDQLLYRPSLRRRMGYASLFIFFTAVFLSLGISFIIYNEESTALYIRVIQLYLYLVIFLILTIMFYNMDRFLLSKDVIFFPHTCRPRSDPRKRFLKYEEIHRIFFAWEKKRIRRVYVVEDMNGRQFPIPIDKSRIFMPIIESAMKDKGLAYRSGGHVQSGIVIPPPSSEEIELEVKTRIVWAFLVLVISVLFFMIFIIVLLSSGEGIIVCAFPSLLMFMVLSIIAFYILQRAKILSQNLKYTQRGYKGPGPRPYWLVRTKP